MPEMELDKVDRPAKIILIGKGVYNIAAEKTLKIETSPDGEEILNEEVPQGKKWSVRLTINIDETDA